MSIREIGTGAPKPLALHLPRPVPGEIRRTHAVRLLRDMFSPERRIVLVEGGVLRQDSVVVAVLP